jgi:acyl-CoA thioester hydrolase
MEEMFRLQFKVRDYECDLQGIVNNSVYQNYLEHARHEFLLSRNISFSELSQRNINLVVTRIELDFKHPLRSGDLFYVTLNMERSSALRGMFQQNIYRLNDNRPIAAAKVFWTAINEHGRPFFPQELEVLF